MLELRDRALVDPSSSGLRYGRGLFESILVRRGRALRLHYHIERLAAGAAFLGLDHPPPASDVWAFAAERAGAAELNAAVLRLYAFDDCLQVAITPGAPSTVTSAAAGVANTVRRLSGSPQTRFKCMSYIDNLLIVGEAEVRGCFDLVALNEEGRLTDGGRTNLFVVVGGEVLTPPSADGALPGVVRRTLIEAGLARERPITPPDLVTCEAAFLTNALRLVVPLCSFEGRALRVDHPILREATARASELGG